MMTIRKRFECALAGERIERPAYAVYDWFVNNRTEVDWGLLFKLGLGQINHATLIRHEHPGFELATSVPAVLRCLEGRMFSPRKR